MAGGRGRVRLEWEVKPLGTPFDGSATQKTSSVDTGTPGSSGSAASFNVLINGLTTGVPYCWRFRTLASSPLFPRSPWVSSPYNGRAETDLVPAASR